MGDGMLALAWNNHASTFTHMLARLRDTERYTDATLAIEGQFYPVHKMVLSTCSEYFMQMFEQTPCKHPVVVLRDVQCRDMEALLSYMYKGVVTVAQKHLPQLIKVAELLKVKGLAVPDEPPDKKRATDDRTSPQPKRQRKEDRSPPQPPALPKDDKRPEDRRLEERPRGEDRARAERLSENTEKMNDSERRGTARNTVRDDGERRGTTKYLTREDRMDHVNSPAIVQKKIPEETPEVVEDTIIKEEVIEGVGVVEDAGLGHEGVGEFAALAGEGVAGSGAEEAGGVAAPMFNSVDEHLANMQGWMGLDEDGGGYDMSGSQPQHLIVTNYLGTRKLCHEGYIYTKKKCSKTTTTWECSQKRSHGGCLGVIITDLESTAIKSTRPHNHLPAPEAVQKLYTEVNPPDAVPDDVTTEHDATYYSNVHLKTD